MPFNTEHGESQHKQEKRNGTKNFPDYIIVCWKNSVIQDGNYRQNKNWAFLKFYKRIRTGIPRCQAKKRRLEIVHAGSQHDDAMKPIHQQGLVTHSTEKKFQKTAKAFLAERRT